MFGLDNNEKELKELLAQLGCEASVFKNFRNVYEKLEKKYPAVSGRMSEAMQAGLQVKQIAEEIECYFTMGNAVDLNERAKELKKLQGNYIHEFLVSSQDNDFVSTYSTVISKLPEVLKNPGSRLMVQSEIENLIAMIREKLEQPKPNMYAYTYFLLDHKDSELFEMHAEMRCEYVEKIYLDEVVNPVLKATEAAVQKDASVTCFMPRFKQMFNEMTGNIIKA